MRDEWTARGATRRHGLFSPQLMVVAVMTAIVIVGLGGPAAHGFAAGERDAGGQLVLSWHAPPDYPGASDTLALACDDSTRIDTLYVGFVLGRPLPKVQAISAVVYFHPLDGDTLGPFWFFKRGWPNQGNMLIELHPSHGFLCDTPWRRDGDGSVAYDHRSGSGRLDMVYGVSEEAAQTLGGGTPMCFAKVLIHHRRTELAGCEQPVAVEFATATIRYAGGREIEISGGPLSVVPWNMGSREEARAKIPHRLVKPWQPKVPIPTPGKD